MLDYSRLIIDRSNMNSFIVHYNENSASVPFEVVEVHDSNVVVSQIVDYYASEAEAQARIVEIYNELNNQ
jgi:hypothetical protein